MIVAKLTYGPRRRLGGEHEVHKQLRFDEPAWSGALADRLGDDRLSVDSAWCTAEECYVGWVLNRKSSFDIFRVWGSFVAELGPEVTTDGAVSAYGTHVPGVLAAAEHVVHRGNRPMGAALEQAVVPDCSVKLGDIPLAWAWAACNTVMTPLLPDGTSPGQALVEDPEDVTAMAAVLRRAAPFSELSERVLGWLGESVYIDEHPVPSELRPYFDLTSTADVITFVTEMAASVDTTSSPADLR